MRGKLKKRVRKIFYFLKLLFKHNIPLPAEINIDIIMPIIAKDLDVLPLSLEGIRRNCANRISEIYLVAPNVPEIVRFAKENNCIFVDELTVLSFGPKDINVIAENGDDRSGWIFQQFIKLSGNIGKEKWFVTLDADHILLKPHTFVDKNLRHVFYQSKECHLPYYTLIKKILGDIHLSRLSYVAHKMVFNKESLKFLRNEIESNYNSDGLRWWQKIIHYLDLSTLSPFSEFETYGNYIEKKKKICIPWNNINIKNWDKVPSYDELLTKYGNKYLAATFSAYNRKS